MLLISFTGKRTWDLERLHKLTECWLVISHIHYSVGQPQSDPVPLLLNNFSVKDQFFLVFFLLEAQSHIFPFSPRKCSVEKVSHKMSILGVALLTDLWTSGGLKISVSDLPKLKTDMKNVVLLSVTEFVKTSKSRPARKALRGKALSRIYMNQDLSVISWGLPLPLVNECKSRGNWDSGLLLRQSSESGLHFRCVRIGGHKRWCQKCSPRYLFSRQGLWVIPWLWTKASESID